MGAAKAMSDAAAGVEHSTVVTTMARNGTDFGIRDPFGNHIRISQPNGATSDEVQEQYDAAGA